MTFVQPDETAITTTTVALLWQFFGVFHRVQHQSLKLQFMKPVCA